MPRIRTVKPETAKHEGLFDAEAETGLPIRFAWVMLPCFCDREGRFQWRPRRLTAEILPYDHEANMSRVLDALITRGFIAKYRVGDGWFGFIPTFTKHQVVNNRESESELPAIAEADEIIYEGNHDLPGATVTRAPREDDACPTPLKHAPGEGKGKERKGREGKEEEPDGSFPAADEPPPETRYTIPLTAGKSHPVTQDDIDRYRELYPSVDVEQSIRNMLGWLDANPSKRSGSARGAKTRMTSWLSRDQDKASRGGGPAPAGQSDEDAVAAKVRSAREYRERQQRLIHGGENERQ